MNDTAGVQQPEVWRTVKSQEEKTTYGPIMSPDARAGLVKAAKNLALVIGGGLLANAIVPGHFIIGANIGAFGAALMEFVRSRRGQQVASLTASSGQSPVPAVSSESPNLASAPA